MFHIPVPVRVQYLCNSRSIFWPETIWLRRSSLFCSHGSFMSQEIRASPLSEDHIKALYLSRSVILTFIQYWPHWALPIHSKLSAQANNQTPRNVRSGHQSCLTQATTLLLPFHVHIPAVLPLFVGFLTPIREKVIMESFIIIHRGN